MRSYLDILTELKDTISSDRIPQEEKHKILKRIDALMELLWPYSD